MDEAVKRRVQRIALATISASILAIYFGKEKVENIIKSTKSDININFNSAYFTMPFAFKNEEISIEKILAPTPTIVNKAREIARNQDINTAIIEAVNFMKKYKPVVRTDIFLPQSLEEFERSGGGDCNETSTYLMSLLNEIKRIKRYNLKINMALVLINENGEHTFHACLILSSPQLNNEWKRISKESILNFNELNENEIKNSVAIDLFSDKVIGVVPKSLMILNENEFIGMYYGDGAASAAYGRKYELAEKYFKMALKYDKNSPVTYYNMSRMYEWRNKFKKAEEYAKKAIELAPNWSYGYFAYSQALYWQHKYKGALEYLEKAKKVDPNFKYYEYKDLMLYYINAGLSKD